MQLTWKDANKMFAAYDKYYNAIIGSKRQTQYFNIFYELYCRFVAEAAQSEENCKNYPLYELGKKLAAINPKGTLEDLMFLNILSREWKTFIKR